LASGAADIVWASTVVHHINDLDAWAAETRRILRREGTLPVRNLFADLGTTSWLGEMPGACRARQIFPTVDAITRLLANHHMDLLGVVEVAQLGLDRTAGAAAAWIQAMRHADTLLLAFRDEEIDRGLARLSKYPADYLLGPTSLGLAAFRCLR
jgi:hypothetical protein